MGTRGLTAVYMDGTHRIAQYGQWDHYPSSQGKRALAFCRDTFDKGDKEASFRAALGRCRFITDDENRAMWESVGVGADETFVDAERSDKYRALTKARMLNRDHGAKILWLVANDTGGDIPLADSISFAGDSLFCEYAYVIDIDKRTFEVYKGFNKSAVPEGERFASTPVDKDNNGYRQIRLLASFSLDALPTDADFLDACGVKSDED